MKQNPVSEEKFDKAIGNLKNDIFERLDGVVEQLKTIRQEQIMA
ncbi:MAG TPA: hypothetical protein VLB73_04280 [Patescibacteria group bacterium]|nr:hypothetical protein [Patescibacteria group bacterium]